MNPPQSRRLGTKCRQSAPLEVQAAHLVGSAGLLVALYSLKATPAEPLVADATVACPAAATLAAWSAADAPAATLAAA